MEGFRASGQQVFQKAPSFPGMAETSGQQELAANRCKGFRASGQQVTQLADSGVSGVKPYLCAV